MVKKKTSNIYAMPVLSHSKTGAYKVCWTHFMGSLCLIELNILNINETENLDFMKAWNLVWITQYYISICMMNLVKMEIINIASILFEVEVTVSLDPATCRWLLCFMARVPWFYDARCQGRVFASWREWVENYVFGGNCVLAGKAVVVRSNRSKFGADFAPPVGKNSLKIVGK